VICRADILLNIQLCTYYLGEGHGETWIPVQNDFLQHTIVWEHLLCIDNSYARGVDLLTTWEKECSFGTVVIHDGKHRIEGPFLWQVHDEIPADHLKGVGMCFCSYNRISGDFGSHYVWLGALADCAPLHVLDHELFHIWPPIVPHQTHIHVENPWMPRTFVVMIHVENALLQPQIVGYHWSSPFEPMMVNGHEPMILCPLLYLQGSYFLSVVHFLFDV
jgi:hypothetical protein